MIRLPGVKEVTKKAFRRRSDTLVITPAAVKAWRAPPFQRPLKVNAKVVALAEALKTNGGVIPGILTLGELGKEIYLLDGQHRIESFHLSGLHEAYADVRIVTFEDMGDMGEEFVELNSRLVALKPDDVLRGLEGSTPSMREIRKRCPFISYGQVRWGPSAPVLSMNTGLKIWAGSAADVPTGRGPSAIDIAKALTDEETAQVIQFFGTVHGAWGTDKEYYRLWGALNLTLCAWLWRRTVLTKSSAKSESLTPRQFAEGAMALSASPDYMPWLMGRNMGERDRAPCYGRIKKIFADRLNDVLGRKPTLPAPGWATHTQGRR